MEELTAAFSGSFQVSFESNSTNASHPRFCQYKMKSEKPSQEKRRLQMLTLQKQKRFDMMKHVRCLTEDVWDDDDDDDWEDIDEEEMEVDVKLNRPGSHYKNQLMFSEWMLEVPEKFSDDWIMLPCPVGKRSLVVASRGQTKSYAKNGRLILTFQSWLPGGSRQLPQYKSDITILDCIYDEISQTFYVLDMMCWKKTPIYDCETEFRFYWLNTKLLETKENVLSSKQDLNRYNFETLPSFLCNNSSMSDVFTRPLNIKLDGILFYHKKAHYTFGTTPLVVWLKAYMFPEILGVSVSDQLLSQTPSTYKDFRHHADNVRLKQEEEKKRNCQAHLDDAKDQSTVENEYSGYQSKSHFALDQKLSL